MRLRRLTLQGFAQFDKVDVRFRDDAPSLIVGPNEAGKSHLMQALYGVLFGIDRPERFIPWSGYAATMRGILTFVDEGGQLVTLQRDYMEKTATITTSGEEAWTAKGSRTPEAERFQACLERWLGFRDPKIFAATTFVQQSEVVCAHLEGVAPQVKRLITGAAETNYERVLADLKRKLDDIWSSNPRKLKPRLLDAKYQELQSLEAQYTFASELQEKISALQERRDRLRAQTADMSQRLERDRGQLKRVEWLVEKEQELAYLEEHLTEEHDRRHRLAREQANLEQAEARRNDFALAASVDPAALWRLDSAVAEAGGRLQNMRQQTLAATSSAADWMLAGIGACLAILLAIFVHLAALALLLVVAGFALYSNRRRKASTPPAAARQQAETDLAQAQQARSEALGKLGVAAVEEALRLREHYDTADVRVGQAQAALNVLLMERTDDPAWRGIQKRYALLKAQVDGTLATDRTLRDVGSASARKRYRDDLRQEVAALDNQLNNAKDELAEVQRTLLVESAGEQDIATLILQIDALRDETARLEQQAEAYRLAIDALDQSVADFNEHCLDGVVYDASYFLNMITEGRYTGIQLDGDLEPTVDMPTRHGISATALSRGVRDQLYFALRVALAKALAGNRLLPLVLDDPYVNFDHERLDCTANLLQEIAQRTQVLLFTCNPDYERWFQPVLRLGRPNLTSATVETTGAA